MLQLVAPTSGATDGMLTARDPLTQATERTRMAQADNSLARIRLPDRRPWLIKGERISGGRR
jgi:hypothetical protein